MTEFSVNFAPATDTATTTTARSRQPLLWTVAVVLLVALALWMVQTQFSADAGREVNEAARLAFEDATGVRIVRIVLAAAGGFVDIHYQVMDPDKALVVHDEANPPVVIDEKSGVALDLPFHDHSSAPDYRTGGMYRLQILNTGNEIILGDAVTLVIGGQRLENLVIER